LAKRKHKISYLRTLLQYHPRIGNFTWKVRRNSHGGPVIPGTVAGSRNKAGRTQIGIDGHLYKTHTLAWAFMTGSWPRKGIEIDHKDGNDANNKWRNLRLATHAQNNWNVHRLYKTNKSGRRGVSWCEPRNVWHVNIAVNKKHYYLGAFPKKQLAEAVEVRRAAELKYYGEYAPD